MRLSVGQKEVSKTSNESSMLSGRAYLYLHLVGSYCNSSGNGDLWMIAASLETETTSVIRNCRFESGWHGLVWQGSIPCAAIRGWYLRKMVCEYDKNIVEYLYQTKDTESH